MPIVIATAILAQIANSLWVYFSTMVLALKWLLICLLVIRLVNPAAITMIIGGSNN